MPHLQQAVFGEPKPARQFDNFPIVVHSKAAEGTNKSLVLLVHGLTGHRYGYWGQMPAFFLEDFHKSDIGLYYYITAWRRFGLWRSIQLEDEAIVLADALSELRTYQSVLLVCHSMGGLLAKGAIAYLLENDRTATLRKIAGLILLASPQLGSLRVPNLLRVVSRDARALYPHNRYIERVDRLYRQRIKIFASGDPAKIRVIPTWAILAVNDLWVDRLSAGIGIPDEQKRTFRETHGSIISPQMKEQPAYQYLRDCLDTCIKGAEGSHELDEDLVCEQPLERDVPAIHQLAISFFGDEVTPEEIIALFIQSPDIFRVVRRIVGSPADRREVLEGYFCVFPLSAAASQALKDGSLTGSQIELAHLAPQGSVPAAIYIGAIAAKDFRSKGLVLYALQAHLEYLSRSGSVELLARPVTQDGERLARKRGLRRTYNFKDKRPLFVSVMNAKHHSLPPLGKEE